MTIAQHKKLRSVSISSRFERLRQRGSSLPFALIALAGLSVTGVSMMRSTNTSALVSGNLGFRETTMRATDVAIEAAVAQLTSVSNRTTDSTTNTYYASVAIPVTDFPASTRFSAYTTDATTGVQYRYSIERMCDSAGSAAAAYCAMKGDTAYYRVTGEATGPKGATQISQVFVTLNEANGPCGIMTQTSMQVSGQSASLGTSKCFHSNEDLTISGGVSTSGLVASAAGTAVSTGGQQPVTVQSNSSPRALPTVNPISHKAFARQIFKADGTYTGTGFASSDWTWDSGNKTWKAETDYTSACPPPGLYYFEANVEIPKSYGAIGAPCELSFIAEGSMKFNGTVYLTNFRSSNVSGRTPNPVETDNVFLMAGGDLELPGGSTFLDGSAKSAMIAAGAEIKVNGSITSEASLVSRSEPLPVGAQNWVTENRVSGELTQTYNGGGAGSGSISATRHSWRAATN